MPELSSMSVRKVLFVTVLLVAGFVRTTRGAQAGADCSSPKDTGPCRAIFPKFFFDPSDKTCKQFTYGGCDGNGNRYDTKEQCQKACGGDDSGDL